MLKKIITLFTGSAIGKVIQFIYFFWIVSLLSKQEFGQYAVSMTLFLIVLYPILEFGSELLINREAARQNTAFYFLSLYWKLLIFPVAAFGVSLVGFFAFEIQPDILILTAGLIFLRSVENGNAACLRGQNLSQIESLHIICSRGLSILILATVVLMLKSRLTIQWAIAFQIAGLLVSILLIEGRYVWRPPVPAFNWSRLKSVLGEGLPLALNAIGWLIYYKIDVLLIGKMVNNSEAGSYEIAFKIMETTFILPMAIMGVTFRLFAISDTLASYRKTFIKVLAMLGISGLVVAIASMLILPFVFPLAFTADHNNSVDVFRILAYAIPCVYMAHLTTQTLVIQKQTYLYLRITLLGAALNFSLNIPLIYYFQLKGAAVATVITELFILIASAFFVYRYTKRQHQD